MRTKFQIKMFCLSGLSCQEKVSKQTTTIISTVLIQHIRFSPIPGLEAILQRCSAGSRMVNLFLLTLFTCSTTREKFNVDANPSLACNELMTSWTRVVESYLKDLVCPFSKKTCNLKWYRKNVVISKVQQQILGSLLTTLKLSLYIF